MKISKPKYPVGTKLYLRETRLYWGTVVEHLRRDNIEYIRVLHDDDMYRSYHLTWTESYLEDNIEPSLFEKFKQLIEKNK